MTPIKGKDNRKEKIGNGYGYIHTCRHARISKNTFLCLEHKLTARSWMTENPPKCPTCQQPMTNLGHRVRVPKKNASNWVWKNFVKLFENKFKPTTNERDN